MQRRFKTQSTLALIIALALWLGNAIEAQAQRKVVVKKTTVVTGSKVRTLPSNHVIVTHRRVQYRYADGLFYLPKANGFVVAKAPVGVKVRAIPKTSVVVKVKGRRLYRHHDVYYRKVGRSYEVVPIA